MEFQLAIQELLSLQQAAHIEAAGPLRGEEDKSGSGGPWGTKWNWPGLP